jgi:hypothetical protein
MQRPCAYSRGRRPRLLHDSRFPFLLCPLTCLLAPSLRPRLFELQQARHEFVVRVTKRFEEQQIKERD